MDPYSPRKAKTPFFLGRRYYARSRLPLALSSAIPSNRKIRRQLGQTFSTPPIVARQCGQGASDAPKRWSHRISLLNRLPLSIASPECVGYFTSSRRTFMPF